MATDNTLSKDFIERQRKRLEALKAEIEASSSLAAAAETEARETRGEEAQEYEEAAQDLDRKEVLQAKDDVDQTRLAGINRALAKIQRGTYGISEISGKPIPHARLEAVPEAVMTVDEAAAGEASNGRSAG